MSMEQEEGLNNQQLTITLNLLNKKLSSLESNFDQIKEIQKKQEKALEKQIVLIEEFGKSNPGAGSSSDNNISKEDLILSIREVLLNDEEMLETFNKVIENITTYNQNKEKINNHVDDLRAKKKKKSPILLISILAFALLSFAIYFIIGFFNSKDIVIKKDVLFYEMNKNTTLSFPVDITVEAENEDHINYYFLYKNKKYYVPKENIK